MPVNSDVSVHMRRFGIVFVLLALYVVSLNAPAQTSREIVLATDELLRGNEPEYRRRMEAMSAKGDVEAQILYGRFLSQRREFHAAERWLLRAAETGNSEAQFHLGGMYIQLGSDKASAWLERSAAAGNRLAAELVQALKNPPRMRDNEVNIDDLLKIVGAMAALKIRGLREGAVACYGTDRQALERNFEESLRECRMEVTAGQEWLSRNLEQSYVGEFSRCVNRETLRRGGRTGEQLLSCLRKLDAR